MRSQSIAVLLIVGAMLHVGSNANAAYREGWFKVYRVGANGKPAGRAVGALRGLHRKASPRTPEQGRFFGGRSYELGCRHDGVFSFDVAQDARHGRQPRVPPRFSKGTEFAVLHYGASPVISEARPVLATKELQRGSKARVTYYRVLQDPAQP